MEKVQSVLAVALDLLKKYWKILVAVIVVIVIIILGVNLFSPKSKAKNTVKSYVSAISSHKTSKIEKKIDIQGYLAFKAVGFATDDDDLDEILDEYDEVDDDDVEEYEDGINEYLDDLCDEMEDYKTYKLKVKKITKTEKIASNLYKVKAKVAITTKKSGDKKTKSSTYTFYVYKNKIIYDNLCLNGYYYYYDGIDDILDYLN